MSAVEQEVEGLHTCHITLTRKLRVTDDGNWPNWYGVHCGGGHGVVGVGDVDLARGDRLQAGLRRKTRSGIVSQVVDDGHVRVELNLRVGGM